MRWAPVHYDGWSRLWLADSVYGFSVCHADRNAFPIMVDLVTRRTSLQKKPHSPYELEQYMGENLLDLTR